MPRAPIAALVQYPLGWLLSAAGVVLACWAAIAHFDMRLAVELAYRAITWGAVNAPFPLTVDAADLIQQAVQDDHFIGVGVGGLFLMVVGWVLTRAARNNWRPAVRSPVERSAASGTAAVAAPAQHVPVGGTTFARSMLSDLTPAAQSSAVGLDTHAGSAPALPAYVEADLAGLAGLFGNNGHFTPQQRAALATLTPELLATLGRLSKWAPSRQNAIIALVVLFLAFQIVPAIFSLLR